MSAPSIIALDPGLTTGVAVKAPGEEPGAGQITGRFEVYAAVERFFLQEAKANRPRPIVVIERFTINGNTAQKSQQLDPLYIIGVVEYLALSRNCPFFLQAPSQAKSFATDAKLKSAGWWVPGQDHARDALRHLMVFLCTHRQVWPELGGEELLSRIVKGLS